MAWRLRQLARRIEQGAVVACSTDSIWGFSCHPLRVNAIRRLLQLKQRPVSKGLILLGSDLEQFRPYLATATLGRLLSRMTEKPDRPTTWIVPAVADCPPWLSPDGRSLAIRVTKQEPVRELTQILDSPLISTSANRSGHPVARNRFVIERQFGAQLDAVIGSHDNIKQRPSRIIDLQSGRILRP